MHSKYGCNSKKEKVFMNTYFKKIISIALMVCLVLCLVCLAACKDKESEVTTQNKTQEGTTLEPRETMPIGSDPKQEDVFFD